MSQSSSSSASSSSPSVESTSQESSTAAHTAGSQRSRTATTPSQQTLAHPSNESRILSRSYLDRSSNRVRAKATLRYLCQLGQQLVLFSVFCCCPNCLDFRIEAILIRIKSIFPISFLCSTEGPYQTPSCCPEDPQGR
jgi:hypothetical protein